eukprot:scaffold16553_cov158-Amphora_coffeaeformis.AAC.1
MSTNDHSNDDSSNPPGGGGGGGLATTNADAVSSTQPAQPVATACPAAADPPPSEARKKRKRDGPIIPRRKKPKDMPKRPLSAYNLFFREERETILEKYRQGIDQDDFEVEDMPVTTQAESKQFSAKLFQAVARTIANRWKGMEKERRKVYERRAGTEMLKYRKLVDEYEKKMIENSTIGKQHEEGETKAGSAASAATSAMSSNPSNKESPAVPPSVAVAASAHHQPRTLTLPQHLPPPHILDGSLQQNVAASSVGSSSGSNLSAAHLALLGQQHSGMPPAMMLHNTIPWSTGRNYGYALQGQQHATDTFLRESLVLPGRNALLDGFALRQFEQQQLLRLHEQQAGAGFAAQQYPLLLGQQQPLPYSPAQDLPFLQESSFHNPGLPHPYGGGRDNPWESSTIFPDHTPAAAYARPSLLERALQQQRQQQQQQQQALLMGGPPPPHAASSASGPNIISVRRLSHPPAHPQMGGGGGGAAAASLQGREGNDDIGAIMRLMEEEQKRRREG